MTTTISRQDHHLQQQQQQQPQQHHHPQQLQAIGGSCDVALVDVLQIDNLNNNNSNGHHSSGSNNNGSPDQHHHQHQPHPHPPQSQSQSQSQSQDEPQKRRSLLNFKSLDFHLKSLYTGLRSSGNSSNQPANSSAPAVDQSQSHGQRRMPYLRVESVDPEAGEAPERRPGTGPMPSHSPTFLSPYSGPAEGAGGLQLPSADAATIRRSSTSDIVSCKRGGAAGGGQGQGHDSRRPSTSDLLRRARERKGSEARMGRSVSHSGLTRGGAFGGGGGLGGRRTSMAF
ncbi:hypothetical protein KR018_007859 [Drosophila ironensis]|nr:hypothetical protein KR018_007859 [Drosophila ironensis]